MNEATQQLLENLKRFLAAGDEGRSYILSQLEVQLIIDEIERLRGGTIRVFSFAELREEARRERGRKIQDRVSEEIKYFPKDSA